MVGLRPRDRVVDMKEVKFWLLSILIIITMMLICIILPMIFIPDFAKAGPPDPSKHYRWEVFPNGMVVLYFMENGYKSRYVYQMVHAVEPASQCVPVYGDKVFKLITWDTTYPYWYTIGTAPLSRWDVKQKKYVKLQGE